MPGWAATQREGEDGFAQTKGSALVEVGHGIVTALTKYVNAVHGLELESPFGRLAAAGLMPERSQSRARVLQEADLPAWKAAVDKLDEKQRDYLLLTLYTGLRRSERTKAALAAAKNRGVVLGDTGPSNVRRHTKKSRMRSTRVY